jgi:hypothetical protein
MMNPYSPPGVSAATFPDAHAGYGASGSATVTDAVVDLLRQTRPWVMLIGVLSFIGSAAMALLGLGVIGASLLSSGAKPAQAALGLFYLPLAFLYIYPGMKLLAFGSAIARLMASRSPTDLEAALAQQKSFWKFSGIASVVVMVLYAVGAVVAVAVIAIAGTSILH